MKIKFSLCCLSLIFILCPTYNFAESELKEIRTPRGKVISGLEREEALERFGAPFSATEEFWHYVSPQEFFVYFAADKILSIRLYPASSVVSVGFPFELKAYAIFSNFKIKDITSQVRLIVSEPENFVLGESGVIIPKKEGDYQILARYKNIFSNPCYVTVNVPKAKKMQQEQLLNIDILPYRPKSLIASRLNFIALGTFFQPKDNTYAVREITEVALWFSQREGGNIIKEKSREMYFSSLGKVNVFAKYKDLESYPQEVEVINQPFLFKQTLKHIKLLPEFIISRPGKILGLRAYATYDNNRIEDVTVKVNWKVSNKDVLEIKGAGNFLTRLPGVTDIIAELDRIESLPAKIIISAEQKSGLESGYLYQSKEEIIYDYEELSRNITKDVEGIKNIIERKLKFIRIEPEYLKIPLGENGEFAAVGTYSDNSQEEITQLAEWRSSDAGIANVSLGKISSVSVGETKIYAKYKNIESAPVLVAVEKPKLISIILSPQDSRISMLDKLNLKAEGNFSDSSRQDITSLVNWEVTKPNIIDIERGKVRPKMFGETKVYAELSGIRSLPADIKVIMMWAWLIAGGISFIILSLTIMFSVLYFITEKKKKKLKVYIENNPKEFIIGLYENIKNILAIFNLSYKKHIPPLSYAESVQNRYSIEDSLFLRFTARFEEAKYSRHILQHSDATAVLDDYNRLLKIIFRHYRHIFLYLKYCSALLRRIPLFIS
jgi:hypothetical protein